MSYRFLIVFAISAIFMQATAQDFPEWNNTEVVQVTYDSSKVSYADLLKVYWRNGHVERLAGSFGALRLHRRLC